MSNWFDKQLSSSDLSLLPETYENVNAFHRFLFIRCILRDRTISEARYYVQDSLGIKYLEIPVLSLELLWDENDIREVPTEIRCLCLWSLFERRWLGSKINPSLTNKKIGIITNKKLRLNQISFRTKQDGQTSIAPYIYMCPVYKKSINTDLHFITNLKLASNNIPERWILRGVALLRDIK
ncbi:unnamed protein product [Rotaria socialis]